MNWKTATRHSIALTPDEEKQLAIAKSKGFGIKKIFKAMLDALAPIEIEVDRTMVEAQTATPQPTPQPTGAQSPTVTEEE